MVMVLPAAGRRWLAGVLIGCLALPAQATGQSAPPGWAAVEAAPRGSIVTLRLPLGAEVTGTLVEARPDAIVLRSSRTNGARVTTPAGLPLEGPVPFPRADIARVSVRTVARHYDAALGASADEARKVVMVLGVDRKVAVRTAASKEVVTLRVRAIEQDGFRGDNGAAQSEFVAYADAVEIHEARMRGSVKAVLAISIVVGTVLLATVVAAAQAVGGS